MSTLSSPKSLLPKPSNFDVFQNKRNQAVKLQRLMPQLNEQNEQDKAAKRKEQKTGKNLAGLGFILVAENLLHICLENYLQTCLPCLVKNACYRSLLTLTFSKMNETKLLNYKDLCLN